MAFIFQPVHKMTGHQEVLKATTTQTDVEVLIA